MVKKLTVLIPDELHTKLKVKAAVDNTTVTEIIIKAIKNIEDPRISISDSQITPSGRKVTFGQDDDMSKALYKEFKPEKILLWGDLIDASGEPIKVDHKDYQEFTKMLAKKYGDELTTEDVRKEAKTYLRRYQEKKKEIKKNA